MAEGAFKVAEGIIGQLSNLVAQEIALFWGVKDDIEKLQNTVSTIKAVLLDAEEKQVQSHAIKDWVEKLKDALDEADKLQDNFSTEVSRREMMTGNKMVKEVRIFFSKSNQLAYRLKMGHKIKTIREKLDNIAEERKFHLEVRPRETQEIAEGALFDVAQGIIQKTGNLAIQGIGFLWGVKEDLEKLKSTISTIGAVLLDAEEQQAHNHTIKNWLGKLKDALDEVDKLLDDFSTEVSRREVMTGNKMVKEVRIFFSKSNQLAYGLKMVHKIKTIREKLDNIAEERKKFHLEVRVRPRENQEMAEGALFDVAQGIIQKMVNLAIPGIGFLRGFKEDVEKLQNTVSTIGAVLLDAEEEQVQSQAIKDWVEKLKDALDEADKLLDDFSTEVSRREVMTGNKTVKELRIFFSKSNQLAYHLKMGHKIKTIREKLDNIAEERKKFHLEVRVRPRETQEMAEGPLFDIAQGIIQKMVNLAIPGIGFLRGVKEDLEKLQNTVSTIGAVLLDAEEEQVQSHAIKDWVEKLKDALDEVEKLLDEFSTEALQREVMTRNKKAKKVRIFFSKWNQLAYGLKMGHKIKTIREKLDNIAEDREKFHLKERSEERPIRSRMREPRYFVHAEDVIGREDDKKVIIEHLLDSNIEDDLSVLPIVGMGGLGKTTLAQLVFNDEEITKHFEQKLWVCVSDSFDVEVIVEKILEVTKNKKQEILEMDASVNELRKEVEGKRYLLVLDDVWNDDYGKWSSLIKLLMNGARGSRILVTTREEKVAKIVKTVEPYFLEGLNEDQSWSFFKQIAFGKGQEPENSRFKRIGMEILEKCRGVPLAIRTVGSRLYFKDTEEEWLSVKNIELSKLPQDEDDILPTLKMSYDRLPSYLKQCFAYCCLFPKDHKIHKPTLIKMWMAQGFIRDDQNQCLEDVGHEYFMDLFWRSFFQVVEKDEYGDILRIKMHHLMHDLAKFVAGSNSITFDSKEEIIGEKPFHVSFGDVSLSEIPSSLFKSSSIRTFMFQGQLKDMDQSLYSKIAASFNFLLLLDLHNIRIQTVPSSIGNLMHLRYLDLRNNVCIKMLSNSITKLQNLQTLRLSGCSKLRELPKDINKLVNLRHLEINGCEDLTHMPRRLGQLTYLQTLSKFVISKNTSSVNGGLNELHRLNELRGTLEIWGLRHEKDAALFEFMEAKLEVKRHLQGLVLKWIELDVNELDVYYDDKSVDALQPHPNLRELSLDGYRGMRFPHWISKLTNLTRFSVHNCNKWQHLPPLDEFHYLKSLNLFGLGSLDYISERDNSEEFSESSILSSLEELTISYCPNLKGWWRQQRDSNEESSAIGFIAEDHLRPLFPRLSKVCIQGCPKLTSMPLFPPLEKLELYHRSSKPLEQTTRIAKVAASLYQFPSLKVLELNSLPALEYISNSEEFLNSSFFPSLEELKLKYCPNLKGWWQRRRDSMEEVNDVTANCAGSTTTTTLMAENHFPPSFPRLSKLCIRGCPQLTSMPLFPFLENLELCNCSFKPLAQTARIAAAAVASTSSSSSILTTSSFPSLSKLKYLEIGRMEEPLPKECMQNLISLDHLWIYECHGPLLQGIQYLTALKQLKICSSEVFDLSNDGNEMEWQGLRSLSSLWFFQLPKLKSLPVGLQHVTSLQKLTIDYCPYLTEIPEWICSLTSLEILEIMQCPKLMSVPEGISRLGSLHTLKICYCPILLTQVNSKLVYEGKQTQMENVVNNRRNLIF